MKKLFLLFAVAGLMTFTACGGGETKTEEKTDSVAKEEPKAEEPKAEEPKADSVKTDSVKKEEPKKEEKKEEKK